MQRPRNRQGRNDRTRGRGRGRGRDDTPPSNIPNTTQVTPGASASIVLKADQETGRQVQGIIADVLTAGNHPRGIKVRLVDGRVGRVQGIVSETDATAGSAGLSALGRNGEGEGAEGVNGLFSAGRVRYRDVRLEEEEREVPAAYSLAAFLPAGHPLLEESTAPQTTSSGAPVDVTTTQVCPVCGEFEGDEIAVSRHVDGHFD